MTKLAESTKEKSKVSTKASESSKEKGKKPMKKSQRQQTPDKANESSHDVAPKEGGMELKPEKKHKKRSHKSSRQHKKRSHRGSKRSHKKKHKNKRRVINIIVKAPTKDGVATPQQQNVQSAPIAPVDASDKKKKKSKSSSSSSTSSSDSKKKYDKKEEKKEEKKDEKASPAQQKTEQWQPVPPIVVATPVIVQQLSPVVIASKPSVPIASKPATTNPIVEQKPPVADQKSPVADPKAEKPPVVDSNSPKLTPDTNATKIEECKPNRDYADYDKKKAFTGRPDFPTLNEWSPFEIGALFPTSKCVQALGRPLDTLAGESADQFVAMTYIQGEPVMGRVWKDPQGKIAASFSRGGHEFKTNVGTIDILLENSDKVRGFDYGWRDFSEAVVIEDSKEWEPVHVGFISPCVMIVDGKEMLGKAELKDERALVGHKGTEKVLLGTAVRATKILCRKAKPGFRFIE